MMTKRFSWGVRCMLTLAVLLCSVPASAEICHYYVAGDLDRNCRVDIADLGLMAQSWLIDCQVTPEIFECVPLDIDGDGFDVIADCNDTDPNLYPGAIEIPYDGIDQDCDGQDLVLAGMVFVAIDDPGVAGHEGFAGYMSRYETTNAQYCDFLNTTLSYGMITIHNDIVYAAADTDHSRPYFELYPAASTTSQITFADGVFSVRSRDEYDMSLHPVTEVSWYGATAFADFYGWRLPTEWEWQAVADFKGGYTYGCGTTISQSKANYDYANPLGLSAYPYTVPAGYYPAYGYGMCEMAGNVWEWTGSASGSNRVARGGSWGNTDTLCTVDYRFTFTPNTMNYTTGFRVCY